MAVMWELERESNWARTVIAIFSKSAVRSRKVAFSISNNRHTSYANTPFPWQMADSALAITPPSMSHFGDLQATRISSCPQLMCPDDDRCQNEPMYHFIRQDPTKPHLIGSQLHASQST
jgi:hypothetical protein